MMHPEYKGPRYTVSQDKPKFARAGMDGYASPASGYITVEAHPPEGRKVILLDEQQVRDGGKMILVERGSDWYPFNGCKMEFLYQPGDQLIIHEDADYTVMDRDNKRDPILLLLRMHWVIGRKANRPKGT